VGQGWDGTVNGQAQLAGSYVWVCHYRFEGMPEQLRKGTLVLLK
jgi:hypothetical protein